MERLFLFLDRHVVKMVYGIAVFGVAGIIASTFFIENPLERNIKRVVMLVRPSNHHSGGTGFNIKTPSGKIFTVTNAHICGIAENGVLHVVRPDGRYSVARVVEVSSKTDLCLVEATKDDGARLADKMIMMEDITVIGHPHLLPLTITFGKALSKYKVTLMIGENVNPEDCVGPGMHLIDMTGSIADLIFGVKNVCTRDFNSIYTNAKILPGNSGSPVFNAAGRVVGVVFAGDADGSAGFFIPLEDLYEFVSVY